MLIDGFTVIAQVINFLILLFLLHRFLYKPILKTIDRRQHQLNTQWQSAHDAETEAEEEAKAHRQAQQTLENQREQILADAQAEAAEMRKAELQQIREDIEHRRQEWQKALSDEQQSLMISIQQQFGDQVMTIVHRILQDLANSDLERQVIRVFQDKVRNLDDETRGAIAQSLRHPDQPITVQTGFDLTDSDRDALHQTLQDNHLLNGQPIHFDIAPDLIIGIRLQNDAYDLAWNAGDYLQDLENTMHQTLFEPMRASASAADSSHSDSNPSNHHV